MFHLSKSLPKWVAHHEVTAFPIGKIEGCRIFSTEDETVYVDVSPEFIATQNFNVPCYFVVMKDGSYSCLTKRLFESYFQKIK